MKVGGVRLWQFFEAKVGKIERSVQTTETNTEMKDSNLCLAGDYVNEMFIVFSQFDEICWITGIMSAMWSDCLVNTP